MKIGLLSISIFLVGVSLVFASSLISSFTAKSDNQVITVKWATNAEKDIKKFELERSVSSSYNYIRISTETAVGSPTNYTYTDKNAYKEAIEMQSENTYHYRIKIIFNNGQTQYSDAINVTHATSSVRKTWGMIKEMMR